jgi:TPR repeat protein
MKNKELKKGLKAFDNKKFDEAFAILLPLAKNGIAQAQSLIAHMYMFGFGTDMDCTQAVKWYKKAAAQREEKVSAVAYNNLGTIYVCGMPGIKANRTLARKYWKKAYELGFTMIPKEWIE